MNTLLVRGGDDLDSVIRRMVNLANSSGETISATFSEINLQVAPNTDPLLVRMAFFSAREQKHAQYIKSPEYKEYQNRRKSKKAQLVSALKDSPEKMAIADEVEYHKFDPYRKTGYNKSIIKFAETWARIMEGRMAKGETLESCLKPSLAITDALNISGNAFGYVLSYLSKVWVHGERLLELYQ